MSSRATTLAVAVTALLALGARPAAAQLANYGQSFVAPSSATFLAAVHTGGLSGSGESVFSLYSFASPNVVGPALFSTAASATFAQDQTLSVGLSLTPGSTYVFLLRSTNSIFMAFELGGDIVAGGTGQVCRDTTCSAQVNDVRDFALTFTAGEMSTVPEPGTWALLATGLFALGGLAVRRKASAI